MREALVVAILCSSVWGTMGVLNRGSIRNIRKPNSSSETWLGFSPDTVSLRPRAGQFCRISNRMLFRVQADLILMAFEAVQGVLLREAGARGL